MLGCAMSVNLGFSVKTSFMMSVKSSKEKTGLTGESLVLCSLGQGFGTEANSVVFILLLLSGKRQCSSCPGKVSRENFCDKFCLSRLPGYVTYETAYPNTTGNVK